MKTRIVVLVALAVLMAASAHAQTTAWFGILQAGTAQDVQAALDNGADANARRGGVTPLMSAANINPDPEVITVLLTAGAELEARDLYGPGATALIWAAAYNPNPQVTAALLQAGADLNARDTANSRTALIWAALATKNPEIVTVLLKAGADVKAKDKTGYTAFDYAKYNEKLKGTDVLKRLEEASK